MGRPIKKKFFGNTGVDATPTIPVYSANITGTELFGDQGAGGGGDSLYIVKQKGARRFVVASKDDPAEGVCKLVNKAGDESSAVVLALGEMTIVGYTTGGSAKIIQKMTNKVATDFDGVRYKWSVSDDSTTSVLVLASM
jgi:hypothetical protein